VCSGLGVPPQKIRDVLGVTKAYCTRVGGGPFPTELLDDTGEMLRKVGSEFGATTGRPRRCGWIDLVALKFACMVNGVTKMVMTKADVLDGFPELQACNGYKINDIVVDAVPFQMTRVNIEPQYTKMAGWHTDTTQKKSAKELPEKMVEYVNYINEFVGVPVRYISNGPGRDQIITV